MTTELTITLNTIVPTNLKFKLQKMRKLWLKQFRKMLKKSLKQKNDDLN